MMSSDRKIRYIVSGAIITCLVVIACFVMEIYANAALSTDIKFSYESGFYEEPIEVELSVGSNYFITYTLDGRAPNAASAKYETPILIEDASDNDNVWANMTETSLRYFEGNYYGIPEHKVDKCTVLRTAAFDYYGNQVNSETREYFIGYDDKPGYEGMYNLCVSTDPENLFSEDRGVYSVGSYLKGKIESCKIYDMFDDENGWGDYIYKPNWKKTGRESEIPATIELFNSDGELIDREKCGVRVYGGISRIEPQKSLRFFARKEYSGRGEFGCDVFGEGKAPSSFLIHSFSQDQDVKLIDYVIYSALGKDDKSGKYTKTIPCNLFLEGEYWGPMFLMRPTSVETLADCFGVDEKNIVLIKDGEEVKIDKELDYLKESEMNSWLELQEFIRNKDMKDPENYQYVCSQLDIEDFAEYAATEIYIGNGDWHRDRNFACWRTLDFEKNNLYADKKWRFCVFDVNWSFLSDEEIWEMNYEDWDCYHMVRCLCQNDEFRQLYLKNILDLENKFSEENVEAIIEEWTSIMEEPIECNFKRFSINADADEQIELEKAHIVEYCINRPQEINKINEWFFSPQR